MAFCPWCGKENADANALCENCGGQLSSVAAQPVQPQPQPQMPAQNPFQNMPKVNTEAIGDFAKAAGSAFADVTKKAAQAPRPQIQTGGYGFPYLISFLFPMFGFIFGAIMLASDSPEKMKVGKTSVLIAIISMLLVVIITSIIVAFNY